MHSYTSIFLLGEAASSLQIHIRSFLYGGRGSLSWGRSLHTMRPWSTHEIQQCFLCFGIAVGTFLYFLWLFFFFLLVVVVVVVVVNILIYYKPCDRWFPAELASTNEPLLTHPRAIHLSKNPFYKKILGLNPSHQSKHAQTISLPEESFPFLVALFEDGTTCQPWAVHLGIVSIIFAQIKHVDEPHGSHVSFWHAGFRWGFDLLSKPLVRLGSFRFAQCEWTRNRFGFGLYSHGLFRAEQIDWCQLSPYAILIAMGMGSTPKKWGSEMKAINGGLNLVSEFNPEKLCSEMKGTSQWGAEKWGSEMKAINGGLNLGSEFNPEKLCSEMKGTSGGLQRWKPSMAGWTSCLSSTPKSCAQRWKVPVGGWTRMWVPVQPRKVKFRDESHQWGVEPRVWVQPRKVVLRDERYQWGVEPACGFQFNPEKWGSEMKAINGGLNLGSEFNPEKLCSEMTWKVALCERAAGPHKPSV